MFLTSKQKKKDKLWFACETLLRQHNQDVMQSMQPQQAQAHQHQRSFHHHHHQTQHRQRMFETMSTSPLDHSDRCPPPGYYQTNPCGRWGYCTTSTMFTQAALNPTATHQCGCGNNCYQLPENVSPLQMSVDYGSEESSTELGCESKTLGCYCENCIDESIDCSDDYYRDHTTTTKEEEMNQDWDQRSLFPFHQMNPHIDDNRCATMTQHSGTCPYSKNQYENLTTNKPNQTSVSMKSAITATAASVFGNCCRGRSISNESSSGGNYYHVPPDFSFNQTNNSNIAEQTTRSNDSYLRMAKAKEMFKAFLKRLKDAQLDTLYQVVERRSGTDGNGVSNSGRRRTHLSSDCILVPRETIEGEEPNVVACRLWSWPDLTTSTELKRIPICPNAREKVYVCCNPAHWNRIVVPETPPPPYQRTEMESRLKTEEHGLSENIKDSGPSINSSTTTTGMKVQIPESFTTNGEDRAMSPLTWCRIAYWELSNRVGERYDAKESYINIYNEGSDGMCLKKLAEENDKKGAASPSSVQKTRQKIGLGITLSQEADGVWLYNQSEAPIFIHSFTLNDDIRHVSKVPPGYCLNAFDQNRARTQKLVRNTQMSGIQTGPIDQFSMQISFAKGWGSKYRRPDITACHCWLEVIFPRR